MKKIKKHLPYQTIRVLLFTMNVLLSIAGFCILAIGLWALLTREVGVFPPSADVIKGFPETMIIYGSTIAVITLIGSVAVTRESQFLTLVQMIMLLFLCAVELILGTIIYLNIGDITNQLRSDMERGLGFYTTDKSIFQSWNNMQRIVQCCGVSSHTEWNAILETNRDQDISTYNCGGNIVPLSCKLPEEGCYQDGCFNVGYKYVSSQIMTIGVIVMTVFMLKLVSLLFAVIMYGLNRLRQTSDETQSTLLTRNNHPNEMIDGLAGY